MTGTITITEVVNKADKKLFISVPFGIFKNDPHWVAPLHIERMEHLDPKKNPLFDHATVKLFLAWRDGKPVGRISAQIDRLHLEHHKDGCGQFGYLDGEDDPLIFAALLGHAAAWLKASGLKKMQGPFTLSINDETGLLVDGFDTPPFIFMGHALPYYARHVEAAGLAKAKDMVAYDYFEQNNRSQTIHKIYDRAMRSGKFKLRALDKKNMKAEMNLIMTVFNDAWGNNWNYIPFTEKELTVLGNNLKMLVTGDYISVVEYEGEAAAFAVTLPNINEWIKGMNGRLLPFNWVKLAYNVIRKRPQSVRLPLMGVLRKYHDKAIGSTLAILAIESIRRYHNGRGTLHGELGWILEDNMGMRSIIETFGAKPYKTYRIYEKTL
jgi:hypothetical protein